MIVREHEKSFIFVQQHHHGHLAEELMKHWKKDMFPDDQWRPSVLTAIRNHDIGWSPFDEQPFWNDATSAPFQFTDFPLLPKTVLYRQGIDEVEKIDLYAAMLCSFHYEQFIQSSNEKAAHLFIEGEQSRRERLSREVEGFTKELFEKHYALLQLGDNFSLYCCVNDSGVDKADEHAFFRNGIPSSSIFHSLPIERIGIYFADQHTIKVEDYPFCCSFDVEVKQKNVLKQDIKDKGLQVAYEEADYEVISFHISPAPK
ncbi:MULTISPECIES: DUF3891 family protein [unclassified Sporosarcina]|uniref:DUF3891 family protein n=1 Tax=unclassified Sporosarcina TaxID=2647733 RepID=UPI000C1719F7|nr:MULTISPECIES: DUF3891 family protein [unclassified Sporosarcina]PID04926.1 hypothetical protein CSV66_12765 [Sporosarcina sp. P30]PID08186.1 hypothetical protein CSV65_12430 [Sporosarcina sp. P31]PID11266.1 hypothetical protein CSV64_13000 [Sporosarcina sp. P32b]